ncbi:MFS transporter [Streptomyces sparsogenes]|uniref:MFS transporter n=1 Tax=Streptomyces sparsogenes TaxID=67365 RepID=UPI0033C9C942
MCIGFFMSLLDGSIVNVAVPTLIDSLDASYDQVLWVIDGYLLVFSVLLITTGRLGDVYGYRRLYVIGIIAFTGASALCGLAGTPARLLAARALQGLGGALLFPQVISSILTIFPPRQRGRAFGLFGTIVGFAPVVGPVLGGFVLAHLSWRWIFFINVPIGIVTAVLALTITPAMRSGRTHRLDLVGVALATTGLTGVVFGLIEGERYHRGTIAGPIGIPSVLGAGVALLVLFVLWQHRQREEPLMPLALFGLLVLAAMIRPTSGVWSLLPGLTIIGIASGATFAPLQQATMDGVDPRLAGAASGVSSTTRQIGGVLGTAVLGVLLSARLSSTLRGEAEERGGRLPEALRARFVDDSAAAGQRFRPLPVPDGLSPAATRLYERLTEDAFAAGFAGAMRTTLVGCALVLVVATGFCSLFGPRHGKPVAEPARKRRAGTASRE